MSLSPAAAEAIQELLQNRDLEGYALRVFVQGGGCSGIQHGIAIENRFLDTDLIIETNGIKVVIDNVSIDYLRGASIDYVDGPQGKGFLVNNPNAMASSCGCGSSDSSSCGGGSCSCG